jgi:mono/diheme cytochrome c family protein/uncharacterized membrane protein
MLAKLKILAANRQAFAFLSILALVFLLTSFANTVAAQSMLQATPKPSFWLWNLLGRLHPLAVHFPVSLVVLAAVLELFTLRNFHSKLRPGINLLVWVGAIAAVISALLGWLLSKEGDYGEEGISLHQWSGFAAAFVCLITLALLYRLQMHNKSGNIKVYRGVLFFTAISISVAGHFGAALTHGSDYLTAGMPWSEDYQGASINNIDFAALKNDTAKLSPKQEQDLHLQVKTIFAHNCKKCHGPEKVKGELRLDRKDMIFKGGESGPAIIAGNPGESELFRRITLPRSDKEAMPSKGKRLSDNEIAVIGYWIQKGAPWPEGSKESSFRVAKLEPRNPPLPVAVNGLQNPVDLWVNDYFKKQNVSWPTIVDDRVFLRRIYLDIIGLLPQPAEVDAFEKDTRAEKRALWIRQLLNRNDDYAIHWLSFWNDLLRNDYTGTGYITNGRYAITDWLYQSLKTNKSYDQFVTELINPDDKSKGFIAGIKWRGVVNASQRVEMQAAQNVAQVFYGINIKCASCHNSFVNNWKLDDAYGFANIFADSSLEINRCDKPTGKYTAAKMLYRELGFIDNNAPAKVKRQQLALNTIKPENGRVYRTLVNRVWAQLMARGIVEPVDDMDNEPWSQDLLDWMAFNFVEKKADIKELIYLITTSMAYQLPSVAVKDQNKIISNEFSFRGRLRKRMTAEQFSDAIAMVVGPVFPDSLVKFNPFGKQQFDKVNQPFPRASLVVNNGFLTALGRPNRETVTTSRESQANLLQALELTNGDRFNQTLKQGSEQWKKKYIKGDVIIKELYGKALGRNPTDKEFNAAMKAIGASPPAESIQDLFWAVMLLPEFQIIH